MADSRVVAYIGRWAEGLCAGGLARTAEVWQNEYNARVRVSFTFERGQSFHCEITDHELRMGGERDLHQWMRTVERHLVRRHEQRQASRWRERIEEAIAADTWLGTTTSTNASEPQPFTLETLRRMREVMRVGEIDAAPPMTATEVMLRNAEAMACIRRAEREANPPILIDSNPDGGYSWARGALFYGAQIMRPSWLGVDFGIAPGHDLAADQRAKDLFRAVAGERAFRILDEGTPLHIKGSSGTRYTLHRRSTFCVQRESDGAQLCVVVPNVPLWDHLLGVKLMVEQDEPKFLATANVVPGMLARSPVDAAFISQYRAEVQAVYDHARRQQEIAEQHYRLSAAHRRAGSILLGENSGGPAPLS